MELTSLHSDEFHPLNGSTTRLGFVIHFALAHRVWNAVQARNPFSVLKVGTNIVATPKCVIRFPLQLGCLTWGDLLDDSLNSCNVHMERSGSLGTTPGNHVR